MGTQYDVTITKICTYSFDVNEVTEQEAIAAAQKLFETATPHISVEKITPCQKDGSCPYFEDKYWECSDCLRQGK